MSGFMDAMARIDAILDGATAQQRDLTAEERTEYDRLIAQAKSLGGAENARREVREIGRQLGVGLDSSFGAPNVGFGPMGDPGAAFVASQGYKQFATNGKTGLVDVGPAGNVALSMKGTLLEGAGTPGAGTGGGWVPSPMVVPGSVQKLFQPLRFEDLILGGQATTSTVRYAVEGTATSAAAGVAEAGLKPESTLAYSTVDEPVRKIATVVQISDELLQDAPAIQSFINSRLSLFVNIEAERQLFRGTSGGNEVQGILTSRNVPVYAGGTAAGNEAVQLFKAMNGMRGSAFLEPEWIVMHPTDYQDVRLLTDTAGQFFAGGPFMGAYGNSGQAGASGQVSGAVDSVWGKPVYVTAAMGGAGTALVGTRDGAQVWNRGGMQVEASTSHSTNFVLNLIAIRAERRLALSVYRSNAYVEVRLA